MKRRAIPAISLALVVLFSASFLLALPGAVSMPASAVTQAEIDALKESAGELEQQQKEIQAQLNAIAADKDEALEQKSLLEQQINVIQSEINNIDAQIAKYDELISQKEDELAQLEQQEAEQYQLFCERVRYMEEEGEVSYWAILFNAEDFSDMLDRFMMVEEIMAYDNAIMDELLATQAQIEQEKAELEEARTAQEEARQKQADAKARLKSQQAEVDALISQISSQEDELEAMEAKLQAAAKAMDNEICHHHYLPVWQPYAPGHRAAQQPHWSGYRRCRRNGHLGRQERRSPYFHLQQLLRQLCGHQPCQRREHPLRPYEQAAGQ